MDIGCGGDPVMPGALAFDREQGDANAIASFLSRQFDYVYSSHCLEHLVDPKSALQQWYGCVRPGGYLLITVPDEDLYEQGVFPSQFNSDHRWTFTISKSASWSPRSLNLLDLGRALGGEIVRIELQDDGYDRSLMCFAASSRSRRLGRWYRRLAARLAKVAAKSAPAEPNFLLRFFVRLGAVVDQTAFSDLRLAQIQLIVRKPTTGLGPVKK